MNNRSNLLHQIAFSSLLLILTHLCLCSPIYGRSGNNSPSQKIKLQLKYYHQFQFAGYYAALHKGFYKEEGLDVELIEGGNLNSIDLVLAGKANYGIAANDILIERINKKPIQLLATIFQSSPSIFLCLESSNIHTAQDLIGKKVMLLDEFRDPELLAIFYQEGIKIEDINRIHTSYNIYDLIDGKTDALNAYSTNEPFFLKEKNIRYTIIYPKTYGIDFYGDGIFTTESEIKNHPKRVDAFLRASKKGWEYALNNSDEIIDLLLDQYNVNQTKDHLRFEAEQIKTLIRNDYIEIGHINPGRLENIAKICAQMGMIPKNYDLSGFIYKPETYKTPIWLKWVLVIIVLISFAITMISYYLFFFNRQLQKAVAKQTASLSEKNLALKIEIEERIKTELALKQSETRFREMIENLPSGAILVEGESIFSNKKAHEITGYTNEEIPTLDSWFSTLYKDKKEENFQLYLETKVNNFKNSTITTIICKDGLEKQVEFHAYSFDKKEIWLMNDITERQRIAEALKISEHKLRTYFEESPNGMVIFNSQTKIISPNPAFIKLMDIPEEKISQIFISDFFAPKNQPQNKEQLKHLFMEGKAQGEVIARTITGVDIPVYISSVRLNPHEFLAFILDISALKRAENELLAALEKAQESDRLKSAFLANMSHEIRTPMNGILGFSQLLMKNNLSREKKEQYIDILNQNGKQLLEIINNIIDISFLEVKQLKINTSHFSIQKLLGDLQIFFNLEKAKYRKEMLEISFINYVPIHLDHIISDSGKIKQILINLINNALKFTKEGGIKISTWINESKLFFAVEDTGIGIPLEKQQLIFERFGQIENIYTRQFGGAGLGLPISKGIIELLNGELYLESEEDVGSKFEFFIPIVHPEEDPKAKIIEKTKYNWFEKKILLVEDEEINVKFLKELLDKTSVTIDVCYNGKKAIELCQSGYKPDLILMDIRLPIIDGIDATKGIRLIYKEIPIIAQTSYASTEDKEKAFNAGCNDFFTKPLNSERLMERIDHFLQNPN